MYPNTNMLFDNAFILLSSTIAFTINSLVDYRCNVTRQHTVQLVENYQ